jgi:tetratricopeptide (TPR) repeat protein
LLAGTHFNLGLMFADQGRSEEALAALQQAEGDFRALAGLTADSDFHWDWGMAASRLAFALWQRATARKGHGRTQEAAADWAQARKYGEQAVQILDKVCAGDATSDGYRLAQAQARSHLGGLLLDGPRPADCLPYLESGLALTLALSRTAPARTDYAVQAAGLEVNLGTFKVYSGGAAEHQEEGLRLGDSALKRLQPILKTVPHHRTANEFFLKAHLLLAEGLEKRKRFGDAVAHWDTFLARIPVGPLVPFWRAKRAYCRARAGEAAAALDDARQLATPPTMVREGQLAGATWTYLALVAALAAGPDPSPEVAQLALTRVEEARVVGYFQTPARVDELKRDPDWEPVRRLPGFGAFLQRFTSDQGNPEPAKAHP